MRSKRDSNLGIRVGDTIIHCNDEFVILDIRREENAEGLRMYIHAADPEQASKIQEMQIKHDQLSDKGTDLLNQLTDRLRKGMGGEGMGL